VALPDTVSELAYARIKLDGSGVADDTPFLKNRRQAR